MAHLDYRVGTLTCGVDVHGRYGPVIVPSVQNSTNGSTFSIYATVSDPDTTTAFGTNRGGRIKQGWIEVYDSRVAGYS